MNKFNFSLFIMAIVILLTISCKKDDKNQVPTVATTAVSNITSTTASSGGYIASDGGSMVTARGVCFSTTAEPTIENDKTTNGSGNQGFTSLLKGLSAGKTYYVRAYATNSIGVGYGNPISFNTASPTLPTLITTSISYITETTATGGGNITSDGGLPVITRGICWSKSMNPSINDNKSSDGDSSGVFVSNIIGLTEGTNYYVRAYATTNQGTGYGNVVSFQTRPAPITDADGNVYESVKIGTQVWLTSNLKTTKFRDGTDIPNITDIQIWASPPTGGYCWYYNQISFKDIYGALYNFLAVTDSRNICPEGWHVPTNDEWTILQNYLGGYLVAGAALKASTLWFNPNTGATNSSGFTALPGGYRDRYGFNGTTIAGNWWTCTSSENVVNSAYSWTLLLDRTSIISFITSNETGNSVRCIKD